MIGQSEKLLQEAVLEAILVSRATAQGVEFDAGICFMVLRCFRTVLLGHHLRLFAEHYSSRETSKPEDVRATCCVHFFVDNFGRSQTLKLGSQDGLVSGLPCSPDPHPVEEWPKQAPTRPTGLL